MSMLLRIDYHSSRPIYEQIREQVHLMIDVGQLKPGDRLPPVRQLASDLATAPATIARAYQELERDGVLMGRGRQGSVVVERHPTISAEEHHRRLQQSAGEFSAQARALGVDLEGAIQALHSVWYPEEVI